MIEEQKPLIELENVSRILTKEVVPVTLVKNINLEINKGEFIAITGPSGSGKSSLLYLLGLLDKPTEGYVFIDGVNTTIANEKTLQKIRLEKIGFVFQFHFLLPEFTVFNNIALPMQKLGKLNDKEIQARVEMLLEYVNLQASSLKKPGQLSGGERQRIAIARSLANNPAIILTDEPTGNLDSKNSANIYNLFKKMVDDFKTTVITITHDMDLASKTYRRIEIVDGEIVK